MKAQVRKDTDAFLSNSPSSRTYQPTISEDFPVISTGVQISDTLRQAADTALDTDLTGAIEPILPMYISIAGSDGKRIRVMLLINPESLNHGKTNATTFAYTRNGFVTQLWGSNQDILTSTGKTAAFMVPGVGITNFFRRRSFGFLNFMALMNAYRNNGYRILDPTMTDTSVLTRVISLVQGVEIDYDNQTYMGHFNTFTLDEDGEHPYLFNYNFEFIISCLNNEYKEVRGHFKRISDKNGEGAPVTIEEGATPQTSNRTGNTVSLLGDITKYGTETPIKPKTALSDQLLRTLWKQETGLNYDEAIKLGYTDNSQFENERLMDVLLTIHANPSQTTVEKQLALAKEVGIMQ